MGILRKLFGPKAIVIDSPVIGVLDLTEGSASGLIQSDEKSFFGHFKSVKKSNDVTPVCDVLMIYAHVGTSGEVAGTKHGIREIIRDAKCSIAVIATENNPDGYIHGVKEVGYGYANLVMTIERNGDTFGTFFNKLFGEMNRGKTMPVAWNDLAPQIPGIEHKDVPGAIFACERGQLAFAKG